MKAMALDPIDDFGLYVGEVMHQRPGPIDYRFRYRVYSLKLDVDQLAEKAQGLRWFSVNRFNLVSVFLKDFGPKNGQAWRPWLEGLLQGYGLTQPPAKITLMCFPRVLGYRFNPLAMWFAYNEKGQVIAIVAEVSNTFGQWHHYVLCEQGQPLDDLDGLDSLNALNGSIGYQGEKQFHVSPFMGMQQYYRFRVQAPRAHYRVLIQQYASDTKTPKLELTALQTGDYQPLTDQGLWSLFWSIPLASFKIILAIHWWALKIKLKGGQFHRTPPELESVRASHSRMNKGGQNE